MFHSCPSLTRSGLKCKNEVYHTNTYCHMHENGVISRCDYPNCNHLAINSKICVNHKYKFKPKKESSNPHPEHECSICLNNINQNATALPCCHLFHSNCINEWRKRTNECPICRHQIL